MTLWSFDFECEKWDRMVLGRAVSEHGDVWALDDYDDVRAWYASLHHTDTAIAHNGGRYDALLLCDALAPLGPMSATLAGSAISSLRVVGGAEILDTARVAPLSLDAFAKAFGSTRKCELGFACTCGEDCGGHCRTSVDMPAAMRRTLGDYCEQDCRATLDAYQSLLRYARQHGIRCDDRYGKPRRTIGGWAWASALEACGLDKEPLSKVRYNLERRAYYGGRCEVMRWEATRGARYDIRSAYPAAMRENFPAGEPVVADARAALIALARQAPGMYAATLDVPEDGPPLLPMRSTSHGLLWPVGQVRGTWTGIEIHNALRHGAKLREVRGALVYPREEPTLRAFIERYWPLREVALANGEKERAGWLKLLLNSLSGKLAQRPGGSRFRLCADDDDAAESLERGWAPMGSPLRDVRAFAIAFESQPTCARPILAATITARTRGRLLERVVRAGDGAVYCDTDSCYQTSEDDAGCVDELGAWTAEGEMRDWFAAGPKMYRYRDARNEERARAKGVPMVSSEDIDRLYAGETIVRRRGVETLRTALRGASGRAFVARELTRTLQADRSVCGRRWREPGGGTRPLHRTERGEWEWRGVSARPGGMWGDLP